MSEWEIKHDELDIATDSLGFGTFGVVHKGKWRNIEVAVKYFNTKTISNDPSFKRETEILRTIKHKNIIELFGMGERGKQHFMVMELAPFSLDYVIHDSKDVLEYDYINVLHWSLQLAEALDYCHNRQSKIIHRDIKPPNMLLFHDGMLLKVCDFGTAKLVDSATLPDTFIGTPFYLAPEIMEGKHTHKCDIFSFAVTLWEMVSRHKPTLDLNNKEKLHPYSIFVKIGKGERPPKIKGIPKMLVELIERCWAQSAADRPSADQIIDKLQKVLVNLPACKPLRKKGEESDMTDVGSGSRDEDVVNEDDSEDTITDTVPIKATANSKYYVHALPVERQPLIPIPGCSESEALYERYCSIMIQTMKAENELESLLQQQNQITQQYDSEIHKKDTITDKTTRYNTLDDKKIKLERYLSDLKST